MTTDLGHHSEEEWLRDTLQRAVVRHRVGDFEEAARLYRAVLARKPGNFDALHWLGLLEIRQGNLVDAERLLGDAVSVDPQSAAAHANLAVVRKALGRFDDALASCDRALAITPRHIEALYNRGIVLTELGRSEEALASYGRVLSINPDLVEAWNNTGALLASLRRYEHAIASYDKAIALRPELAEAVYNRALALSYLGRHEEATSDFQRALDLDRHLPFAEGMLLHSKMHGCDWNDFEQAAQRLIDNVRARKRSSDPLTLVAVSGSPGDQRLCAEAWVRDKCPPASPALWNGERYRHERIRLAYLSADFREHPTAYLMADLFEKHDRARFETIALSFGSNAPDPMLERLQRAFDRFIDVSHAKDGEIAALMRSMEVDIAIDLMGFTADARPSVLAKRPAPVQVNYLGFPATMGASCIDYIIADSYVIPPTQRQHYVEQVVYLPDVFQPPTGAPLPSSQQAVARGDAGLPDGAFVFCCFNGLYKLTPVVFDTWMRILDRVDGSVLWLVGDNRGAETRLRERARTRGIDPVRLIFAERMPYSEHLSRLALADLFLDTLPFNAGATARDALCAGLPVLTCSGEAFAARMAGSLLHAAGVPELVVDSLAVYEAAALRLAIEPRLLAGIRHTLAGNRQQSPLFDDERFRRHIESAYVTMSDRYQRGERAQDLNVATIA